MKYACVYNIYVSEINNKKCDKRQRGYPGTRMEGDCTHSLEDIWTIF